MSLKLGNVPTLFNVAAFHAERSIDQVQTWARELQSSIGSAFRQLEASAKAIEDAVAATNANLEATAAAVSAIQPLAPLMHGAFVVTGTGGFTRRATYGPNGLLSAAASGLAITAGVVSVDLTAQGITLASNISDWPLLCTGRIGAQDWVFSERNTGSELRTSTTLYIQARSAANILINLGSNGGVAVGCNFVLFGQKTP